MVENETENNTKESDHSNRKSEELALSARAGWVKLSLFASKVKELNYQKPQALDPTASLVYIQGHPIFHLVAGIMYFIIIKSNDPLRCYKYDVDSHEYSV